ncbi:hypothetical protein GALMADRAFT_250471 [Galerina marginata CBS 339.88]|uniref:Response regulatory domain-containing protein n=1 Tax=Galerina marginata (strain CBS 339.88) TaxID=685588 RepID=A0A067T3L2_GALM3|nr:hypothetical protein GALMADRAFT_250471 [Galerina marginata CBS 339.88]
MSAHMLPAVRLTADGDCVIQDGVSLDLPPSNKFSVSYASPVGRRNTVLEATQEEQPTISGSDSEPHTSDGDSGDDFDMPPLHSTTSNAPPATSNPPHVRMRSYPDKPIGISRTLSMPLPSQLSQLQHPHRPSELGPGPSFTPSFLSSMQPNQVREVSMELADSIQLVIQTMLQISPPQVLDPAKEQFSACALSVPTSSMSAMFTAMKNINYISANMSAFCEQVTDNAREEEFTAPKPSSDLNNSHNEFDIGEMLQCIGDALSGAAAQAGVDLVLYHGDVGLKHIYVSGDESGISFALSHIVRQVLSTTERGDSIELGLLVTPLAHSSNAESPPVDDMLSAVPLEPHGPVRVKICISHKYAPSETHQGIGHPKDVVTTEIRTKPAFSTLLLRRILKKIDGRLISDLPPPEAFTSGRSCELEMVLDRVPLPIHPHLQDDVPDEGSQAEPTLEVLSSFGETLKGKRVALYASVKGSFAHHLTSYLTAWGMDVSHVSPDGQVDGLTDQLSSSQDEVQQSSFNPLLATYAGETLRGSQTKSEQQPNVPLSPHFIFVDDDVDILKERLQALRFEYQQPQAHNMRKRPSLSSHHRPRSSPQMARLMGLNNFIRPSPVVIIHFTSLANYKVVRDVMQSMMISYAATSTPLPEVMIIPKPAGPRRFLTALHTAVTKPFVDPLFMPIATSPMSPGVPHSQGSFFSPPSSEHGVPSVRTDSHGSSSQTNSASVKNGDRPLGSRSNSDRSTRSNENGNNPSSILPPSPLALPDNVEYFSAAAERLGASPSSGLVIQSPDGQTAGIYFHPRSKNASRNPSSQSMERDRGQLTVPSSRKGLTSRVPSGSKKGEDVTFSALHEANAQGGGGAGGETTQAPPATSPAATPSSPVGPANGQPEQPLLASSILSPVPRRASDDARKLSTPSGTPTDGTPTGRRASKRTDSKDPSSASAKQKGKSATSDNVVPPISVLIVDDNPINQTILSTFMRRKRIKYDLASNGQEAVQKWRTGGFHLILMDIQMPVMDGIQATKEIRRMEKSNAAAGYPPLSPTSTDEGHTPPSDKYVPSAASSTTSETRSMNSPYRSSVIIVALTASSLQSDRVAALAAGCNDFLTKPVSLLWLNNKIIEWGSIKALQMWADIRPESVRSLANGQAAQARNVAEKLHVPMKGRTTPTTPSTRKPTSIMEDNAAAIALASPAGSIPNFASALNIPPSPTSATHNVPDRLPSASSHASTTGEPPRLNSLDVSHIRDALDHPLKRKSIGEDGDTPKPSTPLSRATHRDTNFSNSRSTTPIQKRTPEPVNDSNGPLTSADSVRTRENGHLRRQEEPTKVPSQPNSPTSGEPIHESSP